MRFAYRALRDLPRFQPIVDAQLWPHHEFAHHLAIGERLQRFRRFAQWIDVLDVARQPALGAAAHELVER